MTVATITRHELEDFYGRYVACLDDGRFEEWPEFFTEACQYRIVSRENYDAGLPLSVSDLRSKGALKDRVYGVQDTIFHAPYYQRHIIGPIVVHSQQSTIANVEANYLIIRTKRELPSEVFNAGRYIDVVEATPEGLRFAEKTCVYDSELIPNSIIYPI